MAYMSLHIPCWLGSKLLGFVINLSREKKTYKNLQQLGGKSSGQKNIVYIQNFEVAKNKQVILSNNSFWQKKMHNFGHYTISGCSQPPCKWCDLPYNLLLLGTHLIIPSSTRSGKQLYTNWKHWEWEEYSFCAAYQNTDYQLYSTTQCKT